VQQAGERGWPAGGESGAPRCASDQDTGTSSPAVLAGSRRGRLAGAELGSG